VNGENTFKESMTLEPRERSKRKPPRSGKSGGSYYPGGEPRKRWVELEEDSLDYKANKLKKKD